MSGAGQVHECWTISGKSFCELRMSKPPNNANICHIVHVNRLPSIIQAQKLWCPSEVVRRGVAGTSIGMNEIKRRRLNELTLSSYPDLRVGDCVPFYFCPRSVMLFVIDRANHPESAYRGGQEPIVHLVADLHSVVQWAERLAPATRIHYFKCRLSVVRRLCRLGQAGQDRLECSQDEAVERLQGGETGGVPDGKVIAVGVDFANRCDVATDSPSESAEHSSGRNTTPP